MCSFEKSCCENVVTFRIKKENVWNLGRVDANIFVKTGTLEVPGTPKLATRMGHKKWVVIINHFHVEKFETDILNYYLSTKSMEYQLETNQSVCLLWVTLMDACSGAWYTWSKIIAIYWRRCIWLWYSKAIQHSWSFARNVYSDKNRMQRTQCLLCKNVLMLRMLSNTGIIIQNFQLTWINWGHSSS